MIVIVSVDIAQVQSGTTRLNDEVAVVVPLDLVTEPV